MDHPDALLVLSFGGPEGPEQVLPFLDNVLRGRDVPEERKLAVAEHYLHFGGVSPINAQNRALVEALRAHFDATGVDLPVYWGNRNWHPMLADTLVAMRDDGVSSALVLVTSAFGSWSGCRQYREDLAAAAAAVPGAPALDKLRLYGDHPGFVEAVADGLRATLAAAGPSPKVWFSAHSIPQSMAATAPYERQLRTSAELVARACGIAEWELVYQSRSGPPAQPWLEPDVTARIEALDPGDRVVVCPIGFVSDHMEVVYDLDTEAASAATRRGVRLLRAPTAGTHPAFVAMIAELVAERMDPSVPRRSLAADGAWPDDCPAGCCALGARPGPPPGHAARPGS